MATVGITHTDFQGIQHGFARLVAIADDLADLADTLGREIGRQKDHGVGEICDLTG